MKEEFETYADALWWGLVSHPLQTPFPPPWGWPVIHRERWAAALCSHSESETASISHPAPGRPLTGCTL